MTSFYLSPLTLLILSGCIFLVWSTWWLLGKNENGISGHWQSKSILLFLLLPGLINLAAFYSLALHMYLSLGDWPGIGTDGFPDALLLHDTLVSYSFSICLIFPIFVYAPLWIIFYLVKPIRLWLDKLAAFGVSCIVSTLLTQLAPSGFLYWFWD